MQFVIRFEDIDHLADQRPRHMPAHLEFLDRNARQITAAGPLRDAASALPCGGLWLVEAERPAQVWDLVRADPLWETGLRRSVHLMQWNRVR